MAYFEKVYQKSLALFEDLFQKDDRLYLIVRVRKELHSPPAKSTEIFKRYLKNNKNRYALEFKKKAVRDEEDVIHQYACSTSEVLSNKNRKTGVFLSFCMSHPTSIRSD